MMNAAYLHLVLNHVPILGALFALLLLVGGLAYRSRTVVNAGLLTTLGAALVCILVMQSGEGAERLVEELPGISHRVIHAHEEAAEKAYILVLLAGAIALTTLVLRQRQHRFGNVGLSITLALVVLAFAMLTYAGSLGGVIRHPEAHPAAVTGTSPEK